VSLSAAILENLARMVGARLVHDKEAEPTGDDAMQDKDAEVRRIIGENAVGLSAAQVSELHAAGQKGGAEGARAYLAATGNGNPENAGMRVTSAPSPAPASTSTAAPSREGTSKK
jgi:hypothetical protein